MWWADSARILHLHLYIDSRESKQWDIITSDIFVSELSVFAIFFYLKRKLLTYNYTLHCLFWKVFINSVNEMIACNRQRCHLLYQRQGISFSMIFLSSHKLIHAHIRKIFLTFVLHYCRVYLDYQYDKSCCSVDCRSSFNIGEPDAGEQRRIHWREWNRTDSVMSLTTCQCVILHQTWINLYI